MRSLAARAIEWLGGHELAVMVGSLCVVLSAWGFVLLASEVARGRTRSFDEEILMALRVPGDPARPIGPGWLEESARDMTALGGALVLSLSTLAVAGFLILDRRYAAAAFIVGAVAGGWGLSFALKSAYDRPRPELVPHLMRVYFSSFPSGHSMMSAVVYGTLGSTLSGLVTRRRLKFYFLGLAATLAILVGASRVYLGVHYPTDVLAGWAAGLAWATLCWLVSRHLERRGTIESTV